MKEQNAESAVAKQPQSSDGASNKGAQELSSSVWHSMISVEFQNLEEKEDKGDFVISASGQIFTPGSGASAQPKVLLERQPGQVAPTQIELAAANRLVSELAEEARRSHPKSDNATIELTDSSGVISASVRKDEHLVADAPSSHQGNPATTGRAKRDQVSIDSAAKEAVALATGSDASASYATVHKWPDGQQRAGKYLLSAHDIGGFLLDMGLPPEKDDVDKLVQAGKLPEKFGEAYLNPDYRQQFQQFLKDLHHGRATAGDVEKFLPSDLQDMIASSLVDKIEANGEHAKLIKEALQYAHVPTKDHYVSLVNTIVEWESDWHAAITNNWDSNARAGHPSSGLMQCIPETFQKYRLANLSADIDNPLSNVVAGIRYAIARYGSLDRVPGIVSLKVNRHYRGY
jgi:hypothetical protein